MGVSVVMESGQQVAPNDPVLTEEQLSIYEHEGYLVIRGLFAPPEVESLRERFDAIGSTGEPIPGHWEPDLSERANGDPLKRFPRVMMPHRFDELSLRMLLDQRVHSILNGLLGEEPIAAQSMFYFKPPGAKGQAFHQDNFYLEVKPQTCIAVWTAVDPSIPENGGLFVVPGTHHLEVACPEVADGSESFTSHLVRPPAGMEPAPVYLDPGDVMFFNGSVIHGSQPNSTCDLWRRSFICHYMPRTSTQISRWYFPLLDFNGNVVEYPASEGGGPCGDEYRPAY